MKASVDPVTEALTERIIGAGMEVSNHLGHGFLEAVYRKALVVELGHQGVAVQEEVSFPVHYKGTPIAKYQADIVVEGRIIVELKAVSDLGPPHVGQVLNYLRASGLRTDLLLNFGTPRMTFRRVLL